MYVLRTFVLYLMAVRRRSRAKTVVGGVSFVEEKVRMLLR